MTINMDLIPENTTRKIDSLGRISFPKGIRDRFEIETSEDFEWYVGTTTEGDQYIVMRRNAFSVDPKYRIAAEVLEELGCEMPDELINIIEPSNDSN